MKNPEEAIEKVLAGLRDSEAPGGMEHRILNALEDQASVRSRSGWLGRRPMWLVAPALPVGLAWGVALAGMVVIAVAIPAIHRLRYAPAQSQTNLAPAAVLPPASAEVAVKSAQVLPHGSGVRVIEETTAGDEASARRAEVVSARDSDRDSDSVALSEMRAASHPAPPMPLTEQERLLLRIAHKGDPVEMAMLDPGLRAAQDAEDETDFQRFFGAATTGQPKTEQPISEQPKTEQATTEQPTSEQPTTEPSPTGENE